MADSDSDLETVTSADSGSARKVAAKKAPVKKAAVKKAPAKKAAVKKAPVKKAPVKKAPAEKAVATAARADKTATTKAPAKKAPAKKAPASKAPAKAAKSTAAATPKAAPRKATATKAAAGDAVIDANPLPSDWTRAELAEVLGELNRELGELRGELAHGMSDLDELQQRANDGAGDDQADAGSKTFEREQELSLLHNKQELITQAEHAVERIESGTYGACESCAKPIAKARLQAFPSATLCVVCKQRQERR